MSKTSLKKVIIIFFIIIIFNLNYVNSTLSIGNVGENGINFVYTTPTNYSIINVNNSDYLDNIDSTGFCRLNYNNSGNISADYININNDLRFGGIVLNPVYTYTNSLIFSGGSQLLEQDIPSGDAYSRMLYLPNGDTFQVLNEVGNRFLISVSGENGRTEYANSTIIYRGSNVDALKVSDYSTRIRVSQASNSMTLGIEPQAVGILPATASTYGLFFGISSSGWGWIQQGRIDGSSTAYDLHLQSSGGNVKIPRDNGKLIFGTGSDSSIYYNATDMVINPKEFGSGSLHVKGSLIVDGNITAKNLIVSGCVVYNGGTLGTCI